MTPEQFCYWLQGMLECRSKNDHLSVDETQLIKTHLDTVFTNVTKGIDVQKPRPADLGSIFDDFFHSKRIC